MTIVNGESKALGLAADEFAKYWKLVTGRELPDESDTVAYFKVDPSLDAAHDEYRIRSVMGGIEFTGSNGRSVFYAVYDFFERRAGCRWFWDGDVVPHRNEIDLGGLDVCEKSRFEYRAIRYFAHRGLTRFQAEHWGRKEWKQEIDWCLKSRLNCFMPRIGMDDTWQKAFPDIVGYPGPDDPADDNMRGFDNRAPFWDLRHRGELRKFFTQYAFDRGLMIPTDFDTMTHWYARTPVSFLETKNPPFLPQSNNNYKERTGLVWDVFQGEWADDYIHLTEAFIDAGYGSPDLLHTIGLGERLCYDDRAKNLRLKKDVLSLMTKKALDKYPNAKILLAGWDFYSTWNPDEVKELVAELDPERTIIWDYEGEASRGVDHFLVGSDNNFTRWGVVGNFPYTFGIFLAYESALDIRANYDTIENARKSPPQTHSAGATSSGPNQATPTPSFSATSRQTPGSQDRTTGVSFPFSAATDTVKRPRRSNRSGAPSFRFPNSLAGDGTGEDSFLAGFTSRTATSTPSAASSPPFPPSSRPSPQSRPKMTSSGATLSTSRAPSATV